MSGDRTARVDAAKNLFSYDFDSVHAAQLLEQELLKKNASLTIKDEKITKLVTLIVSPPAVSERERALASLIGDQEPPFARALKAKIDGNIELEKKLLEEDRSGIQRRAYLNYFATGELYYQTGDFTEAANWYRQSIGAAPQNERVWKAESRLASCLASLHDWPAALRSFDVVIADLKKSTDPDAPQLLADVVLNQALVFSLAGKLEESLSSADEAVQLARKLTGPGASDALVSALEIRIAANLLRHDFTARRHDLDEVVRLVDARTKKPIR